MLSQSEIITLFDYVDGQLIWKVDRRSRKVKGTIAGWNNNLNYKSVCVGSKQYKIHQLVWILHNGDIPKDKIIDHINGNPNDNRIGNLRLATMSENQYNSKIRKDNKSGIKGVHWDKKSNKWKAQLVIKGKKTGLGYYVDLELAELVINEARDKFHGNFSNKGVYLSAHEG
jgi:hypothetical protein